MSEAELHVLYARLRGGMLNNAKHGEVILPPPAGLVYNEQGQIILDPDQAVQQSIRLFFATFRRTGSIYSTVRAFREQGLKVPVRPAGGAYHGELVWGELECSRAASILHNPRYTGAFVYGRTRYRKKVNGAGRSTRRLPREEWHTVLRDAHPGYISWEEYEDNLRRLEANRRKPEGIVIKAHRAKAPRFCKDWPCAAVVERACMCAITAGTDGRFPPTSVEICAGVREEKLASPLTVPALTRQSASSFWRV